jgi:hypothetical protein
MRGLLRLAASTAAVAAIVVAQQLPADAKTTGGPGTVTFDDRQVVQTTISFQIVVADKAPASLDVGNAAIADNEGCGYCASDAFAYQFVLAFDGDARITGSGRRQLEHLDAALRRLARSGGSAEEIPAAVEGYADQVDRVLSTELRVRPVVHKKVIKDAGHGPKSVALPPDPPTS